MSNIKLSNCVGRIKESPTLAITAKAAKLKSEGKDIIGLAAGEPDFDTPDFIKKAAIDAINNGLTKYTPVPGLTSLRKAVIEKFNRDNNLIYKINEVLVGVGGKQCIFNLFLALLNTGDEVIIPTPYWVSYTDIVALTGASPILVRCGIDQSFKISPQQLDKSISKKTKIVVLNSPSNPTGSVYSKRELQELSKILLKYPDIHILTDDIYEHIRLDNEPFNNIIMVEPKLKERCIIVNGVSKAYSMTGWRIGFAAGPEKIISAMSNLQSQSTSNPTSISQAAAEAALLGDQSCIKPMLNAFRERHAFVVNAFNDIKGLKCIDAKGAFYSFPFAKIAIDTLYKNGKIKKNDDITFSEYLLDSKGVAVVPGSAFGAENYFRISFATSIDNLKEALSRIKEAIED
ncbi:pyridoxal phosphate-dependent aminotransferase [Nitrosomonadales bacterium]|nr:pyridoxal phosphate-dependent aminotransferase [Nitrosomonadales bacterium]